MTAPNTIHYGSVLFSLAELSQPTEAELFWVQLCERLPWKLPCPLTLPSSHQSVFSKSLWRHMGLQEWDQLPSTVNRRKCDHREVRWRGEGEATNRWEGRRRRWRIGVIEKRKRKDKVSASRKGQTYLAEFAFKRYLNIDLIRENEAIINSTLP